MILKRTFVITIFILLFGYKNAFACSCGGYPSPCQAYNSADAVFIGVVTKIDPDKTGDDLTYNEQIAIVKIEKLFKGSQDLPEITLHQPAHNCAPKFKAGERYLFYANFNKDSKTWEVYGCGRNSSLDSAYDDLLYLNALPESAKRTRISGAIKHYEETPEKGFSLVKMLPGIKVKIRGEKKTIEVFTDSHGIYEVYDLPVDKYTIEPEIPFGLKIRFPMPFGLVSYSKDQSFTVEAQTNSCAGADFVLSSNSVITGKVFDAFGEPIDRVCLDLIPADKSPDRYFRIFDCTEEGGKFKLEEMPPGKYLIVVNARGIISGDEPFKPVYYPGVFEKEKATVITITEGSRPKNLDIRIPTQQPTTIIQGVLLYSDGQPVAKEFVDFKTESNEVGVTRNASTVTDEQGRFSMKVLQDSVGWLRGYIMLYRGKFADCSHINKLLEGTGGNMVEVETSRIKYEAQKDNKEIKLVFSLPFCPKKSKQ